MVMDRELDSILEGMSSGLRITRDEMLLVDWVLTTGSQLLLSSDLDAVMAWRELRLLMWTHMLPVEDRSHGVIMEINESDAAILLAAVPTTFAWGTGVDCGYSLKKKLSEMMLGTYVDPQIQQDIDDAEAHRVAEALEVEAAKKRVEEAKVAQEVAAAALLSPPEEIVAAVVETLTPLTPPNEVTENASTSQDASQAED